MTEEEQEQQDAASALVPAVAVVLTAIAAAEAGGRVLSAAEIEARIAGALSNVALRVLTSPHAFRGASKEDREGLVLRTEQAVRAATQDGLRVFAPRPPAPVERRPARETPATGRAEGAGRAERAERAVARRVAQTVRNSAVQNAWQLLPAPETLRKRWRSVQDLRTRASHAFLGSPTYEYHTVNLTDPFVTIDGIKIRFPGDPLAPESETYACRCYLQVYRNRNRKN